MTTLLCHICNELILPGEEVWSSKLVNHFWCYEKSYRGSLQEWLDPEVQTTPSGEFDSLLDKL